MNIKSIRTFLPSKNVDVSKQFYLDLGFEINWQGDDLILFGTDEYSFFLQKYYQKEWAENLMIQMHVEDLEALYNVAKDIISKYEGTKLQPIFTAHYGKTFHLIDPSGVLWHMTETIGKVEDEGKLICEDK